MYVYRRRVPKHVSHLDTRKEVKISLKTENPKEAIVRATIYNDEVEEFWNALIQSENPSNVNERYKAAVQIARKNGFTYKTTSQVAESSIGDIVGRLNTDLNPKLKAEALLGGAGDNSIQLSECIGLYWELVHDRLFNKSEHKIRKWKNPREAALKNFISVIGDRHIHQINRNDVLKFRSWLNERISKGFSPNSANKQLRFIKDIIETVALNNHIEIEVDSLFIKTNFKYEPQSRRPFDPSFVQNTLLMNLDGLNDRDQHVVMAMADTGARVSEVFGLLPEDIFLDEEIPYIWIRAREGYSLKTKTSERKIPLVGTALKAFKKYPDGFEQLGNPDSFSGFVNRYLDSNNLRPSPKHSIYSLRHTFKDRLRDIEAPEEIIDDLMGHKKSGPKYGRGHKLDTKVKWMELIAYRA